MSSVLLLVVLGIAIFIMGEWFAIGLFDHSSELPFTWERYLLAMTINAIGVVLTTFGISMRRRVQRLNSLCYVHVY
jgi:hypothetical protein